MTDKKTLRRQMKKLRDAMTPGEHAAADKALREKLFSQDFWRQGENILIYVSVGSEVDTREIIAQALSEGKKVGVPRTLGRGEMVFRRIQSISELVTGKFGIPEPAGDDGEEIETGLMLLPGLAFDRNFERLGYGGGYYDRWLARHAGRPVFKCALAYDGQLIQHLPSQEHDVRMDAVLTPSDIYIRSQEVETWT